MEMELIAGFADKVDYLTYVDDISMLIIGCGNVVSQLDWKIKGMDVIIKTAFNAKQPINLNSTPQLDNYHYPNDPLRNTPTPTNLCKPVFNYREGLLIVQIEDKKIEVLKFNKNKRVFE
jgi:hypothetical protein